ncbi:hypothetical protein EUTSA_v10009796mg, partial [Eutrema salsugineum]
RKSFIVLSIVYIQSTRIWIPIFRMLVPTKFGSVRTVYPWMNYNNRSFSPSLVVLGRIYRLLLI